MKLILLLYAMFVTVSSAIGQIDRGQISYEFITGTEKKPDLNEGEIIFTFAPGFSRTETSLGTMGTTVTIVQNQPYSSLMLFKVAQRNFAIQSNVVNADNVPPDMLITEETKMILGYPCKKAIMTRNGKIYTVWFTEHISSNVDGQEVFYGYGNKGFPLEITSNSNGVLITFIAKEISMIVPQNSFDLSIPAGYELITNEQIQEKVMEAFGK